jgi:hypothetical protein
MDGGEDSAKVLAKVCRSMAGNNFSEAVQACQENESAEFPGHLDVSGVLAVLQGVAELNNSNDKVGITSSNATMCIL